MHGAHMWSNLAAQSQAASHAAAPHLPLPVGLVVAPPSAKVSAPVPTMPLPAAMAASFSSKAASPANACPPSADEAARDDGLITVDSWPPVQPRRERDDVQDDLLLSAEQDIKAFPRFGSFRFSPLRSNPAT